MKSVETSVKQYGGDVKWSHTKDRFIVVITFFGNGLQIKGGGNGNADRGKMHGINW